MSIRTATPQNKKHQEIDKKRWLVRYLILTNFGIVLLAKIYVTIFIVDRLVGAYTVITGFVIFSYFFFSYTKFRDPYYEIDDSVLPKEKPRVSIIVPVKNEERFIRNCIESCINSTYSNKEIIVVDDGSTDKTPEVLDEISREANNVLIIHNAKNEGKKRAIEIATEVANGEIYVFMDSDCSMASDAVEKTVKIFMSDNKVGAVTGHGRVRDAASGNVLQKMQDTWYDGQFRIVKGAESSFSTLSCCSGAYSAFRKEAVVPFIHAWVHDKFLGKRFKFATDRRLSAFILGAKMPKKISDNGVVPSHSWKMKYSPSIRVFIGVPTNLRTLIRQQIRWRKSFIRSIFSTGGVYWKRPFPVALLFYLQLGLKMVRPYIIVKSLLFLPITGDYLTTVFYFVSLIYTSMMYGVDFRLRNPGSTWWLYRPLITQLGVFVFTWLLFYALITIRKTAWR